MRLNQNTFASLSNYEFLSLRSFIRSFGAHPWQSQQSRHPRTHPSSPHPSCLAAVEEKANAKISLWFHFVQMKRSCCGALPGYRPAGCPVEGEGGCRAGGRGEGRLAYRVLCVSHVLPTACCCCCAVLQLALQKTNNLTLSPCPSVLCCCPSFSFFFSSYCCCCCCCSPAAVPSLSQLVPCALCVPLSLHWRLLPVRCRGQRIRR